MSEHSTHDFERTTRRGFLERVALGAATPVMAVCAASLASSAIGGEAAVKPAFQPDGSAFSFDTGDLKGVLRGEGKSRGLLPASHVATGKSLAKSLGLFSHYRLLDDANRYGTAGWDWNSTAALAQNGAVEVSWTRDDAHPFDMHAVYRFTAADTLDLETGIRAGRDLKRFEVFLASYFDGFARSFAMVKDGSKSRFDEAKQSDAVWHMYPRDADAVPLIQDGRWKRPPNPVDWTIRPELAGACAVRRDEETGLTAVLMARPADCFAIAMPFGEETHRSVYFSLFGKDLREGETARAKTRLVIRPKLSDEAVLATYEEFLRASRD
jgi:hypothetical protein